MSLKTQGICIFLAVILLCISCSDPASEIDEIDADITISSLIEDQIIDEPVNIKVTIEEPNTEISSVAVLIDSETIYSAQGGNSFELDFDPEQFSPGDHIFKLQLADAAGKIVAKETPFSIHRKLITINLPENMLNVYLVNSVVFASRMDGSLITSRVILPSDRTITLSTPEEFDMETEFMLSFSLTDNGNATRLSTHQNLRRNAPGVINLKRPFRGEEGEMKTFGISGFESSDTMFSESGAEGYDVDYRLELDATAGTFGTTLIDHIDGVQNTPDTFYMYGGYNAGFPDQYAYKILEYPLADDFILDKVTFTTEGVEYKNLTVLSPDNPVELPAFFRVYGYRTEADFEAGIFHRVYHSNSLYTSGALMEYPLNTLFANYRHDLQYANYYTERIGLPADSYTIPAMTVNYTLTGKKVALDISGTAHILGRIQLVDYEDNSPEYLWHITLNSNTTASVVIPELPEEVRPSGLNELHETESLKVGKVELLSYPSIEDYDDYLQKIIKDQRDPLNVTGSYEMIFSGFDNGPIREFLFQ